MQTRTVVKKNYGPLLFLLLWGVYSFIYYYLKQDPVLKNFLGWTSFSTSAILTFIAVTYSLILWQKSTGRAQRIFGFFSVSLLCIFITNLIYQILFNVLEVSHDSISNIVLSSYNIPYLVFLFLQLLIWLMFITKIRFSQGKVKGLSLYIPIFIIVLAFSLFFLFPFNWNLKNISLADIYNIVSLFLQIAGCLAAFLCMFAFKNRGVFYLALSFVIISGTDLIMNFDFFSQSYGVHSLVEVGWILGVFFRIYGLFTIKKHKYYDVLPENWVYVD